jgi:hypothetical protein
MDWLPSSVWICDFSSTTSRTLATKSGSVESLKVSNRYGCRPKARYIRCTVETDSPLDRAMPRELQWVASGLRLKGADDHRFDPGIPDSVRRSIAARPKDFQADARRSADAAC